MKTGVLALIAIFQATTLLAAPVSFDDDVALEITVVQTFDADLTDVKVGRSFEDYVPIEVIVVDVVEVSDDADLTDVKVARGYDTDLTDVTEVKVSDDSIKRRQIVGLADTAELSDLAVVDDFSTSDLAVVDDLAELSDLAAADDIVELSDLAAADSDVVQVVNARRQRRGTLGDTAELSDLAVVDDFSTSDLAVVDDLAELSDLAAADDIAELSDLAAADDISELSDLAAADTDVVEVVNARRTRRGTLGDTAELSDLAVVDDFSDSAELSDLAVVDDFSDSAELSDLAVVDDLAELSDLAAADADVIRLVHLKNKRKLISPYSDDVDAADIHKILGE